MGCQHLSRFGDDRLCALLTPRFPVAGAIALPGRRKRHRDRERRPTPGSERHRRRCRRAPPRAPRRSPGRGRCRRPTGLRGVGAVEALEHVRQALLVDPGPESATEMTALPSGVTENDLDRSLRRRVRADVREQVVDELAETAAIADDDDRAVSRG